MDIDESHTHRLRGPAPQAFHPRHAYPAGLPRNDGHTAGGIAHVSNHTGFLLYGDLVEYAPTKELFYNPRSGRTENYIFGRFG
jgi:hypothetical protein